LGVAVILGPDGKPAEVEPAAEGGPSAFEQRMADGFRLWLTQPKSSLFEGVERTATPARFQARPLSWWRRLVYRLGCRLESWGLWLQGAA